MVRCFLCFCICVAAGLRPWHLDDSVHCGSHLFLLAAVAEPEFALLSFASFVFVPIYRDASFAVSPPRLLPSRFYQAELLQHLSQSPFPAEYHSSFRSPFPHASGRGYLHFIRFNPQTTNPDGGPMPFLTLWHIRPSVLDSPPFTVPSLSHSEAGGFLLAAHSWQLRGGN